MPQCYFAVHTTVRLNDTLFFYDFIKLCKDCTKEPFPFLVKNTTAPSGNSLRFRENLLKKVG